MNTVPSQRSNSQWESSTNRDELTAWVSDRVRLGSRVIIGAGARVLSPADVFPGTDSPLLVHDDVSIGVGSLIAGATQIGQGAIINAGAVVTADVPPYAIVAGNPAVVVGYTSPAGPERSSEIPDVVTPPREPGSTLLVGGASVVRMPTVIDLRGALTHAEVGGQLPFEVKRIFMVHSVPSAEVRGEHAHRTCQQYLVCVAGSIRVSLTDGRDRQDVVLDQVGVGLYVPTLVWATQFRYSSDAVLMVLCSEVYDPNSYVRDYSEFVTLKQ